MNGFREGTTHITFGDRMKENDHRRSKTKCLYFDNGVCTFSGTRAKNEFIKLNKVGQIICASSVHCKRYNDGIRVEKPNRRECYIVKIRINNGEVYVKELKSNGEAEFTVILKNAARFKFGMAQKIASQYKDFYVEVCKIEI